MKVSFIIPVYNQFSHVNQLLIDIRDNCTPNEIVIVDDCSPDSATSEGVAWWARNYDDIHLHRPVNNLGFLKASNYGVSKATGDAICLISTDVRIEEDLAKIVRDLLTNDPKMLIGGTVYTHDTGWNRFNGKTFPYAEGWLLCCTKKAWCEFGGFDERYVPNDFEDVDISTTANSKGYVLHNIGSPKIRHIGGQSIGYSPEREELTKRNRKKFESKWLKSSV